MKRSLFRGGVWPFLDKWNHRLRLNSKIICDHYDIWAGIPKADLVATDYKGKAPWWLRETPATSRNIPQRKEEHTMKLSPSDPSKTQP